MKFKPFMLQALIIIASPVSAEQTWSDPTAPASWQGVATSQFNLNQSRASMTIRGENRQLAVVEGQYFRLLPSTEAGHVNVIPNDGVSTSRSSEVGIVWRDIKSKPKSFDETESPASLFDTSEIQIADSVEASVTE